MIKKTLLTTLVLMNFLAFPHITSAHQLRSEGDIGAVLHVDPEDDPIVGQEATFFFEFKDKSGKLDLGNCDCVATITADSQQLYSISLSSTVGEKNLNTPLFSYTFDQKGVYEIKITGNPTTSNSFQPFSLTYDLRVDREKQTSNSRNQGFWPLLTGLHLIHYIGLGIIIFVFIIFLFIQRQRENKQKRAEKQI